MPGHRRTSPPLSRAERRALIDDAVMIRPMNTRMTAAEVAAVVRAVDVTARLTAKARAAMGAEAQRAKDAAQTSSPRDNLASELSARRRFYWLLALFIPVFAVAHEIAIFWLIHPQAVGYVYPFSLLAALCAAGAAAGRLSPPPR